MISLLQVSLPNDLGCPKVAGYINWHFSGKFHFDLAVYDFLKSTEHKAVTIELSLDVSPRHCPVPIFANNAYYIEPYHWLSEYYRIGDVNISVFQGTSYQNLK